ncbi:cytochrome P450 [Dickeya sp. CFBP 2040]|uniref:Cytochrome P450 n=1 Tax=Dickeya poaceiphila TaxID=568768 RepID=A0A5B8HSD1_9GAMM|nr:MULTISPECIES: cytochrome P450 [Dickeya]NKI73721.1 cytochrome P450 [Dickeya sp. CFBP 2040]QDX31509.1 cytochrome P450 [Dickeya poaceiphila]
MSANSESIPRYLPPTGWHIQNGFLQIAENAHRQYGDLVWIGQEEEPILLLAGARHARLLIEQETLFLKEFESLTSASTVGRIIMGPSLTTSRDGDEWRMARKLTAPTVNPRSPRLKAGSQCAAYWLTSALSEGGKGSLRELCLNWALMCVADGFFGTGISQEQLSNMIAHFRQIYLQLIVEAPGMDYEQIVKHPALVAFRKEVEAIIAPQIDSAACGNATMLQRLCLALDVNARREERERVISLLLGNLAASVDNTGIALLWTLTHLSQQQDYQLQIQEQARHGKRSVALAVVKESLRLTPVTAFFERTTAEEMVIDGALIAKGTRVLFSPWLIHRNKAYWDQPLTYNPERFLSDAKIPPEHYFPFSIGKRNCVGMTLALDQLTTAIITFCEHFTFSLAPDTRPAALKPLFELNVTPRGDIHFILKQNNKVTHHVC